MNLAGLGNKKKLFIVPALAAFCCFANTLGYAFVSDDRNKIFENTPIKDWSLANLARLFDRDIWAFFHQSFDLGLKNHSPFYRPLFGLAFMINYSYGGFNPLWWHLTGILLHAIASILACLLLFASLRAGEQTLTEKEARWLSVIGALVFAIHPAQSESVAWVAAYVNALSSIFIFSSLLSYLRSRRDGGVKWGWMMLSSSFFVLGLLTKEVAIVVPAVIAGYELMVLGRERGWRERLRQGAVVMSPFVLLTLAYLALRVAILGAVRPVMLQADFSETASLPLSINLLTLPIILWSYIKNVIWPFGLSPMYVVDYVREPDLLKFILPALGLLAMCGAALLIARRSVLVRVALIWFIVPLLPMLDIRSFNRESLVQDRYLYISLLGAGLLFAAACQWLNRYFVRESDKVAGEQLRPSVGLIAAVLLVVVALMTVKQNSVWADDWRLWTVTKEGRPDSCIANMQLGYLSEAAGRDSEAIYYYEQAVASCPGSGRSFYTLGMLYGRSGDLAHAEAALQRAIAVSQDRGMNTMAHFNLGVIYEKQGKWKLAIDHYQEGLSLDPGNKNATQVRKVIDELTAKAGGHD